MNSRSINSEGMEGERERERERERESESERESERERECYIQSKQEFTDLTK